MSVNGVSRFTLDNGMTVLLKESHQAPVISWWVWYRVGSRYETPGITGASHWVEHMMFKGTPTFPAGVLDKAISREGGVWNGYTWIDFTTYFETMPADRIDLALRLEADRMVNARFDPAEVESERTVIISERQGAENNPLFLLTEEILAVAFRVHPYHHEVLGDMIDLQNMTRDDLYRHYRTYYKPNNAVAVAVGDFRTDEILARIRELYGPLEPGDEPPQPERPEPEQHGERRVRVEREGRTAYLIIAYRAPAATDPDYFKLAILDSALSGPSGLSLFGEGISNKTSRLYKALVQTELAASVRGDLTPTVDPYLYTLEATVRQGRSVEEVEEAMLAEIDRLRQEPISDRELEKARKQAKALFSYLSESVTNQAAWLGFSEIVAGDYEWFGTYLESLMSVTAEDVMEVAQKYLIPQRRVVGHYIPTNVEENDK